MSGSAQKREGPTPSGQNNPSEAFPTTLPTGVKNAPLPKNLNPTPYVASDFKINYPVSWKSQTLSSGNGGIITIFTPNIDTSSIALPRVDISSNPISTSSSSIQEQIARYSNLKLKQDTTMFHGRSAIRLSGILPFDLQSSNYFSVVKIYQVYMFFDSGDKRFIIDYSYYLDGTEEDSKSTISQILDSYRLE